ncbi:Uma2 family endonuclease [Streptomyces lasalocidi]|uniref:Uma2 family endonuclease n=1 Tax=Streptomyces lasalocidi TaxID=324833 RepID=A0A4U5WHI2_STRLS|nr:Uma2 family endonuclease [Streptomyces lasalocidi]TKT01394.1 Uma2 family endonuclease [Streptomyces lasalocidi]
MTVLADRTEMADDSGEPTLDELFESIERTTPEGHRVEIVEGIVFRAPQRDIDWSIIRRIVRAIEDRFGVDVPVLSDVRIDFPGKLNGYAPDVVKLRDGARKDAAGRWRCTDVEFVAEVISQGTAQNDYGPKKTAYAFAEVPAYLIADPYQGRCHLYTRPKDGEYVSELSVAFGADVDMTDTVLGLTLRTQDFPRD